MNEFFKELNIGFNSDLKFFENILMAKELFKIIEVQKMFYDELQTNKSHKNFENYIGFENSLLELLRLRPIDSKWNSMKEKTQNSVANRIVGLLQEAIKYFKDYVDYSVSIITDMIQIYKKNPWTLAASLHYKQNSNTTEAKILILEALKQLPGNELLYIKALEIELIHADKSMSMSMSIPQNNSFLYNANIFFEGTLKYLSDTSKKDFMINILNICDTYKNIIQFERNVVCKLAIYSQREEFFDLISRRELNGKHHTPDTIIIVTNEKEKIINCLKSYDQAVERKPTGEMWLYYLKTVMNLNSVSNKVKYGVLKRAYDASKNCTESFMGEEHYVMLTDFAPAEDENILADATKNIPHSINLWLKRMCFYMNSQNEDMLEQIFKEGIEALKENCFELWRVKIDYYMDPKSAEDTGTRIECKIKSIYNEAFRTQPDCVANPLKINYLEWNAVRSGQKAATIVYLELTQNYTNNCIELHDRMFELESMSAEPSADILRAILQHCCDQFGENNCSVWIKLMKFEEKHNKNVKAIYEKALTCLDPNQIPILEREYDLIKKDDSLSIIIIE